MTGITYKDAGVDLELYQQAMQKIPGFLARTRTPRVMDLAGGFAGLFRLQDETHRYTDPVLVSGTDGVGTKLKVAILADKYDTVGIDLVAMCVNDCLCLGAQPLFFLDYLALGKDNPPLIADLVDGVTTGCQQAESALLGGETAIMPDVYAENDFDMAGFSVGVVERDRIVDGTAIMPGDVVIGLQASGFHSNGYSLLRKLCFDALKLDINDRIEELNCTVGEMLLTPTRIYVKAVQAVLASDVGPQVHGMAHITGGGLAENIERILPEQCKVILNRSQWQAPPVFDWLKNTNQVEQTEADRVFNNGVGYVIIVPADAANTVHEKLQQSQIPNWTIGNVTAGERGVEIHS